MEKLLKQIYHGWNLGKSESFSLMILDGVISLIIRPYKTTIYLFESSSKTLPLGLGYIIYMATSIR